MKAHSQSVRGTGVSPVSVKHMRDSGATVVLWIAALMSIGGLATSSPAQERKAAKETKQKARPKKVAEPELAFPPALLNAAAVVTDTSPEFLQHSIELADGVTVAKTPPTIDFAFFPGQTYVGRPWSAWGDSLFANGKYYASIGDHLAPQGNAFVYEFDPAKKTFRQLLDLRKLIDLPDGHYTPGKIHSRLDLGRDGWLYCSTHRGSTNATTDANHYEGDWIVRCHPETAKSEIVARGPVGKHCLPNGTLDGERMIFYGGTAPGDRGDNLECRFFAYDVANRKLLHQSVDGPQRYMILAQSSGKVYFTPGLTDSPLMRFDPASGSPPVEIPGKIGIRAATRESPTGDVITVSHPRGEAGATLYRFNTRTEKVEDLGPAPVGSQAYVAAMSADGAGRFVYYVPGAHGGANQDGSPIVQFDTKNRTRKVIAFLSPFYEKKYGASPRGTYSVAVDPEGARVFITWNVSRGGRVWDCTAVTVVHVPATERPGL
jgi:hypothetical protein